VLDRGVVVRSGDAARGSDRVSVAADALEDVENKAPWVCRLELLLPSIGMPPLRSRDSRLRADKLQRHSSLGILPVLPDTTDARVSRLRVVGRPNGSAEKIDCRMASSSELQVEAVDRMGEFAEHTTSLSLMATEDKVSERAARRTLSE